MKEEDYSKRTFSHAGVRSVWGAGCIPGYVQLATLSKGCTPLARGASRIMRMPIARPSVLAIPLPTAFPRPHTAFPRPHTAFPRPLSLTHTHTPPLCAFCRHGLCACLQDAQQDGPVRSKLCRRPGKRKGAPLPACAAPALAVPSVAVYRVLYRTLCLSCRSIVVVYRGCARKAQDTVHARASLPRSTSPLPSFTSAHSPACNERRPASHSAILFLSSISFSVLPIFTNRVGLLVHACWCRRRKRQRAKSRPRR